MTGINTLGVFSPTKQALDQDLTGNVIRARIPELATVPPSFVHPPWRLSAQMQPIVGRVVGEGYPPPIADRDPAVAELKRRIAVVRKLSETRRQSDAVQEKHGSRRKPSSPVRRRPTPVGEDAERVSPGQLPLLPLSQD